jgi:hypothetical protein
LLIRGIIYDAERFAQVTLDNLKDPANGLNQESHEGAQGYYDLANVYSKDEGEHKTEKLVKV